MFDRFHILEQKAKTVFLYNIIFLQIPRIIFFCMIISVYIISTNYYYNYFVLGFANLFIYITMLFSISIDVLYLNSLQKLLNESDKNKAEIFKYIAYFILLFLSLRILNELSILRLPISAQGYSNLLGVLILLLLVAIPYFMHKAQKVRFSFFSWITYIIQYTFFPLGVWAFQKDINLMSAKEDEIYKYIEEDEEEKKDENNLD